MQFTTFLQQGKPRLGVVDGDAVVDLNAARPDVPSDLRAALEAGVDLVGAARACLASAAPRLAAGRPRASRRWCPSRARSICLGLNYFDHAKEGGRDKPDYPWFFFRGKSSLLGHGAAGRGAAGLEQVRLRGRAGGRDRHARAAPRRRRPMRSATSSATAASTTCRCATTRSARRSGPSARTSTRTGGFGPVLVTADELPPGATGLRIQSRLNGQVMQDANTDDMIFSVAETIALLSECLTLEPGDVIVMGTPAGVGQARTPPVWMKAGDTIEIEIERIGVLRNPIVERGRLSR